MKRLLVSILVPVFMLAGLAGSPTMAQDKAKDAKAAPAAKAEKGKAVIKVLIDNDHWRVTEITFKPGDVAPMVVRPNRMTYVVKGGTLERIYADGKVEKVPRWKVGEARELGPDPVFSPKNVGKTDVVLISTVKKAPK